MQVNIAFVIQPGKLCILPALGHDAARGHVGCKRHWDAPQRRLHGCVGCGCLEAQARSSSYHCA